MAVPEKGARESFSIPTRSPDTLAASMTGAEKITKVTVVEANVDKSYRGHDDKGTAVIRNKIGPST